MPEANHVYVVDDEEAVRESMLLLMEAHGLPVRCFESAEEFLRTGHSLEPGCIVSDMRMPGMDGIGLLEELRERDLRFPVIVITAHGEVPLAVSALKAGAVDFIEKPFAGSILIDAVLAALLSWSDAPAADAETPRARQQLKLLTAREHEVLGALVAGKSNKEIAECLGISPRTVESSPRDGEIEGPQPLGPRACGDRRGLQGLVVCRRTQRLL